MRLRHVVLICALPTAILLWSPDASATSVRLGLGVNYWLSRQGLFDLTLAIDTQVARPIAVGGRFGAAITTSPARPGVPLDLLVRFTFAQRRVYLAGYVGPWIFFQDDVIRFHVGIGFGLNHGSTSFGLEMGWLDPRAMVGVKVAFRF